MKYKFFLLELMFFCYIIFEEVVCFNFNNEKSANDYLNALQIIRKYGYPAEAHTIETEDGYLLQMHRIPHGKNATASKNETRQPVFLQHGLFCSSEFYLLTAPNSSLALMLADLGYDVWLGNVRGNTYSRAHVTLKPNQFQFWNYTWHECAMMDISAQINFICNHTKSEQIIYVGHSMGTTMFFALMSQKPEYNSKIKLSLLMAPVAYMKNIRSLLLRFLAPFSNEYYVITKLIGNGEFLPRPKLLNRIGKIICKPLKTEVRLCLSIIYLLVGSDPDEYDESVLEVLLDHFSGGYSVKGVNHYAQLVESGKFRQYDYGKLKNMIQYGSLVPPDYFLKNITAPMYFYVGKNDYLATMADVKRLATQLESLKDVFLVQYPKFTHLDFVVSKNVKEQLYDRMIDDMTKFLNR